MTSRDTSDTTRSIGRRRFLGALGVAALPAVAGCTGLTEHEFAAGTVLVDPEDAELYGYVETLRDSVQTVEQGTRFGVGQRTSVTNHIAVYTIPVGGSNDTLETMTASAFSTPKSEVYGQSLNPLASESSRGVLSAPSARWALDSVGIDLDSGWQRDPTRVGSGRTAFVDGSSRIFRTYGGVLGPADEPSVVFAHVARRELEADVVFGLGVRTWVVADPDRPFVGEDGYLTDELLANDTEAVTEAFEAFRYE